MKSLFNILFFFCLVLTNSFGQDVGISGSYSPGPIRVNETSTLKVIWVSFSSVAYPIGEVYILVNVPKTNYSVLGTPTGAFLSTYFTDFNDADNDGVWFGRNTSVIPSNIIEGVIDFTVRGDVIIGPVLGTLVETNFENFQDPEFGDNLSSAGLQVDAALPIELLSFNAKSSNCGEIDLLWETASEYNNNYVEVQRSTNAIDFVALSKIGGTNTNAVTAYSYIDNKEVFGGVNYYYRLKQVDFDGKFEYSKVISQKSNCLSEASFSIYPNPTVGKLFIDNTTLDSRFKYSFKLLDQNGKLLKTFTHDQKSNNFLSLEEYTSGVYYIIPEDSKQNPKKIIKIE